MVNSTVTERFLAKIEIDPVTGCWLWTASLTGKGYGQAWNGERVVMAHRLAYEMFVGPVPVGLVVDHVCHLPSACAPPCEHRRCVNPDHLEPVTAAVNSSARRSASRFNGWWHRSKASCPAGHPYDAANTYINPSGFRVCRECTRTAKARYRARKKAA